MKSKLFFHFIVQTFFVILILLVLNLINVFSVSQKFTYYSLAYLSTGFLLFINKNSSVLKNNYVKNPRTFLFIAIIFSIIYLFSSNLFYNFFLTYKQYQILKYLSASIVVLSSIALIKFKPKKCISIFDISKRSWYFSVAALILVGIFLRTYNLGVVDLHHDEYWLASTIRSYFDANSTNLWNYATNQPSDQTYPLAIFTVLIGSFVKITGYSETTLRIIPAIFGSLLLLVFPAFTFYFTRSKVVSLLATYFVVFSPSLTYLSRFLRQYSLLHLTSVILLFILLYSFQKCSNLKRLTAYIFAVLLNLCMVLYISPFAYSFLPLVVFAGYYLVQMLIIRHSYKVLIYFASTFFLSVIIFLDLSGRLKILNIEYILSNNFIFGFSSTRTLSYIGWVFDQTYLPPLVVGLLTVMGFYFIINRLRFSGFFTVCFFIFPLFFLIINQYHSYDFRYVSYLIPFQSIFLAQAVFEIMLRISKNKNQLLTLLILIPIVFGFSLPIISFLPMNTLPFYFGNVQTYASLSRRAVPPNYKKTFSLLAEIQKPGDAVIVLSGLNYLRSLENADYYIFSERKSNILINMRTNERISFEDAYSSHNNTYLVGSYFHNYVENYYLNEFIISKCTNLANTINIFHYHYSDFYSVNSEYSWPSLWKCPYTIFDNK